MAQEVVSELYELRISYNWADNQNDPNNIEPLKHVQINAAIQSIVSSKDIKPEEDGQKTN